MQTGLTDALSGAILDALGESVTVNPPGGAARTIQGVFGQRFADDFDMQSQETIVTVDASANSDLIVGSQVVARSTNYEVARVENDGSDLIRLVLHEE